MPLFSVIIPTYNRADFLIRALDSVFAQEFTDYEVIVADDGSSDATAEMAARYGDRVRYFRQDNRGPGPARNLGIRQAQAEYITFLDSDDIWFPWTLRTFARVIADHNQPAFVAGTSVEFNDALPLLRGRPAALGCDRFADYYTIANGELLWIGGTCAVAIRADVLRSVGGFADRRIYMEDLDLWMKLGVAPGFVLVRTPALFGYWQQGQSAVSDLEACCRGGDFVIDQESTGRYPGGEDRKWQRLRILSVHLRPLSIACLERGRIGWGWRLFYRTLGWSVRLRRLKYIAAIPLLTIRFGPTSLFLRGEPRG